MSSTSRVLIGLVLAVDAWPDTLAMPGNVTAHLAATSVVAHPAVRESETA